MSRLTNGKILPHVLLYGLPGSCKTMLMERFKKWYEADSKVERVSFVDCTTMTKAGVENWILDLVDSGLLPEVMVLDEIEKVEDKKSLLSLLSVMSSGVIARLNSRIGNRRRDARFVVVGICNNEKLIKEWNEGALWSRFGGNRLPCVRPSRDLCSKILREMVLEVPGGKPEWADASLLFGWDKLRQRDIREIKDHLCGMDRLLTGEWQHDHMKMLEAKEKENQQVLAEGLVTSRKA
jgi:hypothetical protein